MADALRLVELGRDLRLLVPHDASVHCVASLCPRTTMPYDAVLVCFAPSDAERTNAAARRSDCGRVREYLRTGRVHALCETDPASPAVRELLRDLRTAYSTRRPATVVVSGSGVRRLVAGCAPVAALLTMRSVPDMAPPATSERTYMTMIVRLPDGRLACAPATYELEEVATGREQLREYAALVGTLAEDARPPCQVLGGALPPHMAPRVRKLLRDHARLLSARRRAAAAIGRAWCRYDGAPHGPRARYLCDLEHGWSPPDGNARPCSVTAIVALFGDAAAYRAYVEERAAALRPLLRRERDPAARVRLRLAALCPLRDGPHTEHPPR